MFDGIEVDAKFEGKWLMLSKSFRLQAEKQRFHFIKKNGRTH